MGRTKTKSTKSNDFFNKISPLCRLLRNARTGAMSAKRTSSRAKAPLFDRRAKPKMRSACQSLACEHKPSARECKFARKRLKSLLRLRGFVGTSAFRTYAEDQSANGYYSYMIQNSFQFFVHMPADTNFHYKHG
jgi:hypothetical protein